jgi:hypothetical protein
VPLCGALCAAQVGLGGWGSRWIPAPVAADSSESIHAHVDVDDEDGEPAAVCMRWPGVETVDLSMRLRPDSSALLRRHITD